MEEEGGDGGDRSSKCRGVGREVEGRREKGEEEEWK